MKLYIAYIMSIVLMVLVYFACQETEEGAEDELNVGPVFRAVKQVLSIEEGNYIDEPSDVIVIVKARDENGDEVSYRFKDMGVPFSIDEKGVIRATGLIDYERRSMYQLVVEASDGEATGRLRVSIHVSNMNDNMHTWKKAFGRASVPENAAPYRYVMTIPEVLDPDGAEDVEYRLRAGSDHDGKFIFNRYTREIITGTNFDYEEGERAYEVVIEASDGKYPVIEYTLMIEVENVNDNVPTWTEAYVATNLAEDVPFNTRVVRVPEASDGEGDLLTYTMQYDFDGRFIFNPETLELLVGRTGFDYESGETNYNVVIEATDGENVSSYSVEVTITDVNDIIVWSNRRITRSVDEDVASHTFVATVPEVVNLSTNPVVYRLKGDNTHGGRFVFTASNRQVTVGTVGFDYEVAPNTYEVIIEATDEGDNTNEFIVTVDVSNVNDNPVLWASNDHTLSLREDIAGGTALPFSVAVSDADGARPDGMDYEVSIEADGAPIIVNSDFAVNDVPLRLSIVSGGGLDYETKTSYTVRATVSDGENTDTFTLTINVEDVNDVMPSWATASFATNLDEGTAAATVITNVPVASDADTVGMVTYRLEDTFSNRFAFAANTDTSSAGTLSIGTSLLDYESGTTNYDVVIKASDGVNAEATYTLRVTVGDVDDPPTWASNTQTISVCEDLSMGELVLEVPEATNVNPTTLAYRIKAGNDHSGLFTMATGSRELTKGMPYFFYNTKSNFSVVVEAYDRYYTSEYTVTVKIIPVGPSYWVATGKGTNTTPSSNVFICVGDRVLQFKSGVSLLFHDRGEIEAGNLVEGFTWTNGTNGTFSFHSNTTIYFHTNGQVDRGPVTATPVVTLLGRNYTLEKDINIHFYESGAVKSGKLVGTFYTLPPINSDISFYESGVVETAKVAQNYRINIPNVGTHLTDYDFHLKAGTDVTFYDRSDLTILKQFTLNSNSSWTHNGTFHFKSNQTIDFHETGVPKSGTLRINSTWTWTRGSDALKVRFKADNTIDFHDTGAVKEGRLSIVGAAQPTDTYWSNSRLGIRFFITDSGDDVITFHPNSNVKKAVVWNGGSDLYLAWTNDGVFYIVGETTFYEDGMAKHARLANSPTSTWTNNGTGSFTFKSGTSSSSINNITNIYFHPNGVVSNGTLHSDATWTNVDSTVFTFKSNVSMTFHDTGAPVSGTLAGDVTWTNGSAGSFAFPSNTTISFHATGKVDMASLDSGVTWTNADGDTFPLVATNITFHDNGAVKSAKLSTNTTWTNVDSVVLSFTATNITFHTNGKVASATLSTNTTWTNSGNIPFPDDNATLNHSGTFNIKAGDITFYDTGKVASATLSTNINWTNNGTFVFSADSTIRFHSNGSVREGVVAQDATWTNTNIHNMELPIGNTATRGNPRRIHFYDNGNVDAAGGPRENVMWTNGVYGVHRFGRNSFHIFFHRNGTPKQIILVNAITFTSGTNTFQLRDYSQGLSTFLDDGFPLGRGFAEGSTYTNNFGEVFTLRVSRLFHQNTGALYPPDGDNPVVPRGLPTIEGFVWTNAIYGEIPIDHGEVITLHTNSRVSSAPVSTNVTIRQGIYTYTYTNGETIHFREDGIHIPPHEVGN